MNINDGLGQQAVKNKILNNDLSMEDNGRLLLREFQRMRTSLPDPVKENNRIWNDMYEEFNQLQASKDNKIPKTEFETKYSMFFNPENRDKFRHASSIGELWKEKSNEFLKRINPYMPFFVVDDYDHDKILKIFPPIFREIDTLNITKGQNNRTPITDEEGNAISSADLAGVVNNIFDKYNNHQLASKKQEGAILLKNCLLSMQDKKRILEDMHLTDVIIQNFYMNKNQNNVNISSENDESSLDDYGISFE